MNQIPTLYHGTDARIIEMSAKERKSYFDDVKNVIDCLWNLLKPYMQNVYYDKHINGQVIKVLEPKLYEYKELITIKYGEVLWYNIYEKLLMLSTRDDGNEYYQYGSLYLTNLKIKAGNYARRAFAGGELGLIAYRLIQAAEILEQYDFTENDAVMKSVNNVKAFAESSPKPVIIPITEIDINYLFSENGKDLIFVDGMLFSQCLRYTKPYNLCLDNAEYLNCK